MSRHRSPISLLLRVLPGPAAAGVVVGQIEEVSTGAVVAVRGEDDLREVVCRLAAAEADAAG
jgi:hypothetical protein